MLRPLARAAFARAGGLHVARYLNRHSLRILMFHSFLPRRPDFADRMAARCRHLKRFYRPVSLTEAAQAWSAGAVLPPNALAITVDDGYRDFYELAYPIFAEHRLPVIVYLVTGFMDGRLWLWPDQLRHAVETAAPRRLDLPLAEGGSLALDFTSDAGRAQALQALSERTKRMPNRERVRFMADLPVMIETEIPRTPPPEYAPLAWAQVREMADNGIEFGLHTATHPILSRVETEAELRDEIEGAKRRIEQELGPGVRHFCYPNGKPEDIDGRVVAAVERAGFDTAVVTSEGFNRPGANRFLLKRIPADPDYTDRFFAEYAAGVRVR